MKADVHTNFAFPFVFQSGTDGNGLPTTMVNAGLTKRELFAMAAMQGMIASSPVCDRTDPTQVNKSAWVKQAVGFADALLEALEK